MTMKLERFKPRAKICSSKSSKLNEKTTLQLKVKIDKKGYNYFKKQMFISERKSHVTPNKFQC